jgi:carboxyl-terminal processing protease
MKLSKATHNILLVCTGMIILLAGIKIGESRTRGGSISSKNLKITNLEKGNTANLDFSLFWETWDTLGEYYVDKTKLDPKKMYYGAIKGMVASVNDNYTFFLTPEENQQSKDDLKGIFFGIGAELGMNDNQIVVVTPLKNSPAEKAGVKPGDVVVKVNHESTTNWTLQQAVAKIRGPKGEKVILTMRRNDKDVDVTVVRDEINIPFVETKYEGNVAIIELSRFGEPTNDLWDKTVEELLARKNQGKLSGIVLDMRGNPGGYLDGAIHVASEFLTSRDLVVKQEYADKEPEKYYAKREGKLQDMHVVVLLNKGSASASEIVAGALRDHKKATIVGENSFGKGTVQQALDLGDNAGLHVTISKWILPGGSWIQETGIKPDVEVKLEIKEGNTMKREDDAQLDKAIEILKSKVSNNPYSEYYL